MEIGRPLRAATAAGVAWLAVQPLGGYLDDYTFYAPLGAVVAVTTTVVGSVRESMRTIVAMALGVGLAAAAIPLPQVVGLLCVVGIGTLLANSPIGVRLGTSASWVPVTGMFVLVIGGDSPWNYAAAYLGLTTFGALVGMSVNLLWPPFPLRAERVALVEVRESLARQLERVAESLRGDLAPSHEEWTRQRAGLDPVVDRVRALATQAADSRRGNWRIRRWPEVSAHRYEQTRALERLAFMVDDLVELVRDQEHADRERVALGRTLRPYAAAALEDLAKVVRLDAEKGDIDDEVVASAERSTEALVRAMRGVRRVTGDDLVTAGGIATVVGRTLATLAPDNGHAVERRM